MGRGTRGANLPALALDAGTHQRDPTRDVLGLLNLEADLGGLNVRPLGKRKAPPRS